MSAVRTGHEQTISLGGIREGLLASLLWLVLLWSLLSLSISSCSWLIIWNGRVGWSLGGHTSIYFYCHHTGCQISHIGRCLHKYIHTLQISRIMVWKNKGMKVSYKCTSKHAHINNRYPNTKVSYSDMP